ncbi:MAG: cyclic nucleotide-binding domain-containing protein [Candidatus Riflebacteria bacterium]|nr:cyclic nucleotide-binding domain-containing protein [Candidatus Riflebacteria bacterium]
MTNTEALAGSALCRYIEDEDVELVYGISAVQELSAGQNVFCEGDPGGSLFVLLTGKVDVWKKAGASEMKHLATLGAGEIIGEISLVDSSPRSALVTTASPCTLLELTRRALMGLLRTQPIVAARILWAILETVSLRLRDMNSEAVRWQIHELACLPKADI